MRVDIKYEGFPGGASGKEPACQCRRHKGRGFDSWVGKFLWRMAQKPTPVFLTENPIERGVVHRAAESDTTEATQFVHAHAPEMKRLRPGPCPKELKIFCRASQPVGQKGVQVFKDTDSTLQVARLQLEIIGHWQANCFSIYPSVSFKTFHFSVCAMT